MTTQPIATTNASINHYGSTIVGPVASTVNDNPPSFVFIESDAILSSEDTVDTPTHAFDPGPPIQYHEHLGQVIDNRQQSYVFIETYPVLVQDDSNSTNDTRIDDAGQSFVVIE